MQSLLFTLTILLMVATTYNNFRYFGSRCIDRLPSKSLRDLPLSQKLNLGTIMSSMSLYMVTAISFAYTSYLSFRLAYLISVDVVDLMDLVMQAEAIEKQSSTLDTVILVS